MSASCRSCGASIIWGRTLSGKMMPVDAEPSAKGNVLIIQDSKSKEADAVTLPNPAVYDGRDGPLRLSHYATCPNATAWRAR